MTSAASVTRDGLFNEIWIKAQEEVERAKVAKAVEFYKTKKIPEPHLEGVIFRIVSAWQNAKIKEIKAAEENIVRLKRSLGSRSGGDSNIKKAIAEWSQKKRALKELPESPFEV